MTSLDRDELVGSATGGAVAGSMLGFFYRGVMAIPAGLVMYGSLAFMGQYAWTAARHYRQELGLNLSTEAGAQAHSKPPGPFFNPFKSPEEIEDMINGVKREIDIVDPIKDMFVASARWIEQNVVPKSNNGQSNIWTRSLDDDYKVELNAKLFNLYDQVIAVKEEVARLELESLEVK